MEKANTQERFRIDKNLPNKIDDFLKDGSLDEETEILKIIETLSEKLNALENKEAAAPNVVKKDEERGKTRIHKKWGKDPFSDHEL